VSKQYLLQVTVFSSFLLNTVSHHQKVTCAILFMSMTLPMQNRLSTGLGPPWTAAIEPACACSNRTNGSGIYSEVPGDGGRRVIGAWRKGGEGQARDASRTFNSLDLSLSRTQSKGGRAHARRVTGVN
jgi:hypothetical protein